MGEGDRWVTGRVELMGTGVSGGGWSWDIEVGGRNPSESRIGMEIMAYNVTRFVYILPPQLVVVDSSGGP